MSSKASALSKASAALIAVGGLLLLAFIPMALILGPATPSNAAPEPKSSSTASSSPAATPTQDTTSCEPEYTQVAVSNENGRVDNDFAAKYAAATAEANNLSEAQRDLLIDESGKSARTLAAWAHAFGLYEDPNNLAPLVDGNCLSSEGQRLHAQFDGALSANGSVFEEAAAPADGFNSGVNNGVYGASSTAGVTGDLKAIKVTLKNGTVVYIMVRCGNPVFPGKPNLPEVPTDNPPPPVTPPTDNPPPVTPPNTPKNPAEDPYPRGNAPVGGGRNADPGPGTYVPPSQMEQPPSTPRVNPAPPPAAPPAAPPSGGGSGPAPTVPTPDPAPAPAPEPEAPAPSAPETGCVPIPGVMDC